MCSFKMGGLYFQWHITDACNFRCRHCYQDKFDNSLELDVKGLKAVADKIIQQAKVQNTKAIINITGGEPFLKKELFVLLNYLDGHEEIGELLVITNASLVDDVRKNELKEIKKLNQVKISLDGATAASNDAIRGKGFFAKAMEAIKLLKESGYSITIMFTAMKSNLKEIKGLYELCQKLSLDGLILERFFPMGEGAKLKDELLDRGDWLNLVKAIFELTGEDYLEKEIVSQRAFWVRFLKRKTELWGASCNVGRDSFCIMPNADLYPCRRFTLKIGNLLETPLADIINSFLLTDIINGTPKGRCAECDILGCRGCPALAYLLTGDYHSQDSQCWYKSQPIPLFTNGN